MGQLITIDPTSPTQGRRLGILGILRNRALVFGFCTLCFVLGGYDSLAETYRPARKEQSTKLKAQSSKNKPPNSKPSSRY